MKKNLYTTAMTLILGLGITTGALAQMSGTYTIGGTSPDYTTIQEACDSVVSQGISGAVVLSIRDGVYAENVTLNSVTGTSVDNTITIQSENADNNLVSIMPATGMALYTEASYLVLRNITIESVSGNAVQLQDGTNYTIDGCHVETGMGCCGSAIEMGNYEFPVENLMITNSTMTGYYGFYADVENLSGVDIDDVEFVSQDRGLYLYADVALVDVAISNCDATSSNSTAIELEGYYGQLSGVSITNCTANAYRDGIYLYSDQIVEDVLIDNVDVHGKTPTSYCCGDGIQIEGYYSYIYDVTITNVTFDSLQTGIEMYTDYTVLDVTIDEIDMHAVTNSGIDIEGYYAVVEDVEITNVTIEGGISSDAIYVYSDNRVEGVTIAQDSIIGINGRGIYVEGDNGVSEVMVHHCYIQADTFSDGIYVYSGSGPVVDLTLHDLDISGGDALEIECESHLERFVAYNNNLWGRSYGINVDVNYGFIRDMEFYDNDVYSKFSNAMYIYTNNAGIQTADFWGLTIEAEGSTGIYFYLENGASDVRIADCSIDAQSSGIEWYGSSNGVYDLTIEEVNVQAGSDGIYLDHDYGNVEGTLIQDCEVTAGAGSYGIYLESDDGEQRGTEVANNLVHAGHGIYLEGDYGGVSNSWVHHNEVHVMASWGAGVEFYEAGSNNTISYNWVDTAGGQSSYNYGVYVYGYDNATNDMVVHGNELNNVSSYGIYLEYSINDAVVTGNTVKNLQGDSYTGIYLYEGFGETRIDGNQFLSNGGSLGMDIQNSVPGPGKRAWITNNFLTGFDQTVYMYSSPNFDFVHNSVSVIDNGSDAFYADWGVSGLNILNNIFQFDTANFAQRAFYFYDVEPVIMMDYNVYNLVDSGAANFVFHSWDGNTYANVSDWMAASGNSTNSMYYDVDFINDTTDLHVVCSQSGLSAGMPWAVGSDIEGNERSATPTIGADEILTDGAVFSFDTVSVCADPIQLDAGANDAATYAWSSGDNSQSIWVAMPGVFTATVTDACGTYIDEIEVVWEAEPEASLSVEVNGMTAFFLNTSTDAVEYVWDFGDGNTSDALSPRHEYHAPGMYTVTLSAIGECMTKTETLDISLFAVGVEAVEGGMSVHAFPNPTNGMLNLRFDGIEAAGAIVRLIALDGRQLLEQEISISSGHVEQFDLADLPGGIYTVLVQTDNGVVSRRIVRN